MKGKHITLQVPEPCHENWDSMDPRTQGRFCNACSKTVVDFTQATESDLIHYFREYKGGTCGRYRESQLNKPMQLPPEPRYHPVFKWVAGLLMYFGWGCQKSEAQNFVTKGDTVSTYLEPKTAGEVAMRSGLRGRVTDENGRPLAEVRVICQNTTDTVFTDRFGAFVLPFFAFQSSDKIILEYHKWNYSRAEYQSLYADIPASVELNLTEIPFAQRPVVPDSLLGDSAHPIMMDKIIIELEPQNPEIIIMGKMPYRSQEEREEVRRRRPPLDLMSNTTIIE